MKIFTKEEWAEKQYKGQWSDSPYFRDMVALGELPAYYIGRRDLMVNEGKGPVLITEGVHFLIEGDYSNLPILCKANALVGAAYQFGDSYHILKRIYRLTEEQARERGTIYLDRAETTVADFALTDGDIYNGGHNP